MRITLRARVFEIQQLQEKRYRFIVTGKNLRRLVRSSPSRIRRPVEGRF